ALDPIPAHKKAEMIHIHFAELDKHNSRVRVTEPMFKGGRVGRAAIGGPASSLQKAEPPPQNLLHNPRVRAGDLNALLECQEAGGMLQTSANYG
ncbi:MAG: hypothetical protein ACR2IV_04525, partial [Bryobacteraceae bacterium]